MWAFAGYCLPLTSSLLRSAILPLMLMLQLLTMIILLLIPAQSAAVASDSDREKHPPPKVIQVTKLLPQNTVGKS